MARRPKRYSVHLGCIREIFTDILHYSGVYYSTSCGIHSTHMYSNVFSCISKKLPIPAVPTVLKCIKDTGNYVTEGDLWFSELLISS